MKPIFLACGIGRSLAHRRARNTLFAVGLWSLSAAAAWAACPVVPLPENFNASQVFRSSDTQVELESKDSRLGKVTAKDHAKRFELTDPKGALIATGELKPGYRTSSLLIKDCEGHALGMIQEDFFPDAIRASVRYSILDPQRKEISSSGKIDWLRREIVLSSTKDDSQKLMTMSKGLLSVTSDRWEVHLSSAASAAFDPRVAAFLPGFKVEMDDRHRNQSGDGG